MSHEAALAGFRDAYQGVDDLCSTLTPHNLLAASRCHGWLVADVLYHLLTDARRALVALATPAPGPADVDSATYWQAFAEAASSRDPIPGIWSIRRATAAFHDGSGVTWLWQETSAAAVRAATSADPARFISTQGHVLAVPDFLATLATEAAIHHLDMTVDLPDAPAPRPSALAVTTATLDALAGPTATRPANWSTEEYILKGTGRLALSPSEQRSVKGYPLLG